MLPLISGYSYVDLPLPFSKDSQMYLRKRDVLARGFVLA